MRRLWALLLLASAASYASAQTPAVRIDLEVGFRGVYTTPSWVPLRVTLENAGGPVHGTLRVETSPNTRFGTEPSNLRLESPLSLAGAGRKTYRFVVPIRSPVQRLQVSIRAPDATAAPIAERDFALPRPLLDRHPLVALSSGSSFDFLLASGLRGGLVPVYPIPERLPERWIAYDGVGAVVLHDADLTRLSDRQIEALLQWTRAGGTLSIAAGTHFSMADAQRLGPLLPFAFDGLRSGSLALAELGFSAAPASDTASGTQTAGTAREGAETGSPARVRFSAFAAADSDVAIRAGDVPLLLSHRVGSGTVRLLTVDQSTLRELLPGAPAFWQELFRPEPGVSERTRPPLQVTRKPFDHPVAAPVLRDTSFSYRSRWTVLAILAGYIVLMALAFRYRPTAVPLLAAAALVSALAFAMPTLRPPNDALYAVESAHMDVSTSQAVVEKDIILAGTKRYAYRVSSRTDGIFVPKQGALTRLGSGAQLHNTIAAWNMENHFLWSSVELPVRVRFETEAGSRQLVLRNDSSIPLEDVQLIEDGSLRALGTVPSDAERSFAAPAATPRATDEPQEPQGPQEPQEAAEPDGAAGAQGRGLPPVRRAILEQLVKLLESDADRIATVGSAAARTRPADKAEDGEADGAQAAARDYLVFWLSRPLLRTEVDHSPTLSREVTVVTIKLPAGWRHAE